MKYLQEYNLYESNINEFYKIKPKEGDEVAEELLNKIESENITINGFHDQPWNSVTIDNVRYVFYYDEQSGVFFKCFLALYNDRNLKLIKKYRISLKLFLRIKKLYKNQK